MHIRLSNCSGHFKSVYLKNNNNTSLICKSLTCVPEFLSYLHSQHPNGKFPVDLENLGNKFGISVYRNPTFTGLSSKFSSFISFTYKRKLVNTLANQAYICSNWTYITQEHSFIYNLLDYNGFSKKKMSRINNIR